MEPQISETCSICGKPFEPDILTEYPMCRECIVKDTAKNRDDRYDYDDPFDDDDYSDNSYGDW